MQINKVQADARGKIYLRTEDGIDSYMSVKDALAEVNDAMMGRLSRERSTRTMSSSHGHHVIEYRDGRRVSLVEIDAVKPHETDNKGRRIIAVKGKRYVVGSVTQARPRAEGASTWIPEAYVSYWAERNGERFGATRSASGSRRPGTVGRAIWDAVSR
ncbi:hypothetical protein [Streptomyces sp. NPDC014685]|uniref:hypothetical protein n=1 Tax=Streptomyces sp. NPDC014685 TaxID=3364881 RepID=UPI0036F68B93